MNKEGGGKRRIGLVGRGMCTDEIEERRKSHLREKRDGKVTSHQPAQGLGEWGRGEGKETEGNRKKRKEREGRRESVYIN